LKSHLKISGENCILVLENMPSFIVQHEVSHLNGICINKVGTYREWRALRVKGEAMGNIINLTAEDSQRISVLVIHFIV